MKHFLLFALLFCSIITYGQVNLDSIFKQYNVTGSVTIYDFKNQKWVFSDPVDANVASLPASTFKIINSCIALELGVIKDEHEIIAWDGKVRKLGDQPMEAWNKDNDLVSAYKNSTIWFYEALAEKITKDRYKQYLSKCHYGNGNLTEPGVNFWVYGAFAIDPISQIQFLKNLHFQQLPFSKRTYAIMKKLMISEENDQYTFRDKTGWATKDGKDIGWWVGYVETKNNVYFFATRVNKDEKDNNPNFAASRKEITKEALRQIKAIE